MTDAIALLAIVLVASALMVAGIVTCERRYQTRLRRRDQIERAKLKIATAQEDAPTSLWHV